MKTIMKQKSVNTHFRLPFFNVTIFTSTKLKKKVIFPHAAQLIASHLAATADTKHIYYI